MFIFLIVFFVSLQIAFCKNQISSNTFRDLPQDSSAVQEQLMNQRHKGMVQQKIHTLGFGISTTDGDATTGKQSFMLSAQYGYKLFPLWDIEVALQQTSMTKWYTTFGNFFAVSSALSQDITMFTSPFTSIPNFRLGVGSSLRWQKSVVSLSRSIFDPATGQSISYLGARSQNTFAVGATLKMEYLFPIAQVLDISIRAQGHIFAPPIIGENNHVPGGPGGAASLGIFFLIHP
jgi:hypothetical protein